MRAVDAVPQPIHAKCLAEESVGRVKRNLGYRQLGLRDLQAVGIWPD